jgi:hypothetical protein
MTVNRTVGMNVRHFAIGNDRLELITLEELLLQLSLGDLDLDGLVDLLLVSSLVVGIVLNRRREKCVDEGSLSQAGFTSDLNARHQSLNSRVCGRA